MSRQLINAREQKDLDQWHRNTDIKLDAKNVLKKTPVGAPKGNSNRKKHGIYSNRFLNNEEVELFNTLTSSLMAQCHFDDDAINSQIELIAIYSIKLSRAIKEDNDEAMEILDSNLRAHLSFICGKKEEGQKKSFSPKSKSPCEIVSDLFYKYNIQKH